MKRLRKWLHRHALPKVEMKAGMVVGDRFKCTGPFSALPFNPFEHPQWQPSRVNFNGRWIAVQATERTHEDFGWEAVSVEALNRDDDVTPAVEVRGPR